MAPSTVIGEELAPLIWVMTGKVVSSLMDMACTVDLGRMTSSAPESGTELRFSDRPGW